VHDRISSRNAIYFCEQLVYDHVTAAPIGSEVLLEIRDYMAMLGKPPSMQFDHVGQASFVVALGQIADDEHCLVTALSSIDVTP